MNRKEYLEMRKMCIIGNKILIIQIIVIFLTVVFLILR